MFYFDDIYATYLSSSFLVPYPGLDMIVLPSGIGLYLLFLGLFLASILFTIGYWFRPASWLLFLGYTYLFLGHFLIYHDHRYLILLLLGFSCVTAPHAALSIHASKQNTSCTIPFWMLLLFRFQFLVMYLHTGHAKLFHRDWRLGLPIKEPIAKLAQSPLLGDIFSLPLMPSFIAYISLLFDLSIGLLLCLNKTRSWAILAVIFYSLINIALIISGTLNTRLGIFPYLGIASCLLFMDPKTPTKWFSWISGHLKKHLKHSEGAYPTHFRPLKPAAILLVVLFFGLQLVMPFRHHLYHGHVSQNEHGALFSWLDFFIHKYSEITVSYVDRKDPSTPIKTLDLGKDLSPFQYHIADSPFFIWSYIKSKEAEYAQQGRNGLAFFCNSEQSLNGRDLIYNINSFAIINKQLWKPLTRQSWILPY